MSIRLEFVQRFTRRRRASVEELCSEFGISRKTGYKWIARFSKGGVEALLDRSHAPHDIPHRVSDEVERLIKKIREEHASYGPKKIRTILEKKHPLIDCPATSTIGEVLRRKGLVVARRRRSSRELRALVRERTSAHQPNDVWTADFKGHFKLGTGCYCYPLTLVDHFSRYLLGCKGQASTAMAVTFKSFERAFEEYGLPRVIRTDNGIPFAHPNGFGRLSTMAVWWIKMGIRPELIRPASPQENGRHERMHKTLKAEATRPASSSLRGQQKRFDQFRDRYNNDRPHESLGMQTPASQYETSEVRYPGRRIEPIEYPSDYEVRLVNVNGFFKFHNKAIFLSHALSGENIGLKEAGDGAWVVSFGRALLGELFQNSSKIVPLMTWEEDRPR